jgi:hypothetical protein
MVLYMIINISVEPAAVIFCVKDVCHEDAQCIIFEVLIGVKTSSLSNSFIPCRVKFFI